MTAVSVDAAMLILLCHSEAVVTLAWESVFIGAAKATTYCCIPTSVKNQRFLTASPQGAAFLRNSKLLDRLEFDAVWEACLGVVFSFKMW